jgi:hypothetical protein
MLKNKRTVPIRRAMYDFTSKLIIMHIRSVLFRVIFRMVNTNVASFSSIASSYAVNKFHVNQGTQNWIEAISFRPMLVLIIYHLQTQPNLPSTKSWYSIRRYGKNEQASKLHKAKKRRAWTPCQILLEITKPGVYKTAGHVLRMETVQNTYKSLSDNPKIRDILVRVGEDRKGNVFENVKLIEVAQDNVSSCEVMWTR